MAAAVKIKISSLSSQIFLISLAEDEDNFLKLNSNIINPNFNKPHLLHRTKERTRRRFEGNDGKNILALHMIQRVLKSGIYADYLLVDSWYAKPNFIYEIKESEVEKWSERVKNIMEHIMDDKETFGVPIVANASCGENWGEMR